MDLDERRRRFLEAAVWGPFDEARQAGGSRNAALNTATFALGPWVAGGVISRQEAEAACETAAAAIIGPGFTLRDARYTIRRALTQGEKKREPARHCWPEDIDPARSRGTSPASRGRSARPAPPPLEEELPARPPAPEVAALWSTCLPLDTTAEEPGPTFAAALDWLRSRGLTPAALADLDLVRVLPAGLPLPSWAAMGRRTWLDTGHLLVVQGWSAAGELESLHARFVLPGQAEHKSVWPAAGPGSARGLIFANGPARRILSGCWPKEEPPRVVIAEGVPDWLTWCSRRPDIPIFGMTAGGWTAEHATRVPDGAAVAVWTDPDMAGDKYAARILESFAGRRVNVARGRAEVGR